VSRMEATEVNTKLAEEGTVLLPDSPADRCADRVDYAVRPLSDSWCRKRDSTTDSICCVTSVKDRVLRGILGGVMAFGTGWSRSGIYTDGFFFGGEILARWETKPPCMTKHWRKISGVTMHLMGDATRCSGLEVIGPASQERPSVIGHRIGIHL